MNFKNIYDPETVHRDLVTHIEGSADLSMVDPTNSYALMLESIGAVTSEAVGLSATLLRSAYPSLAPNMEELLRHATDEELMGLYASPASAKITIFMNAIDILNNGSSSDISDDTRQIQISSGTRISVQGTTFSTVNDIRVHFDGTTSIVEQLSNNNYGFNRFGSIPSVIHKGADGGSWIKFDIYTRQFSYNVRTVDVVGSLDLVYPITDSFWHITAEGIFDDGIRPLRITHSDIVYDPNIVTLKVTPLENEVKIHLPNIYRIRGIQPKSINITVFETKGKFHTLLNEYSTEEYELQRMVGDLGFSGVTVLMVSDSVVTGGRGVKSLEEVRANIIGNTTGPLITPVTFSQLQEKVSRDGYELSLYSDIVTHRLFTIAKNIDAYVFGDISSDPDIFLNEAVLTPDISNYNIDYGLGGVVLKHHTLMETINGNTTPVTDQTLLNTYRKTGGYTKSGLVDYMRSRRLFYTPYTNIIYKDYICKTYDLLNPNISNLEIINRNIGTPYRINIDAYSIEFVDDYYEIVVTITNMDSIDTSVYSVLGQIIIPTNAGGTAYFDSVAAATSAKPNLTFRIPTNSFIDLDGNLSIDDNADVGYKQVPLTSEVSIMLYVPSIISNSDSIYVEERIVRKPEGVTDITGLTNHGLLINFAQTMDHLFNETTNRFTPRKYKTYEDDVPYFHSENVYAFEIGDCNAADGPDMTIVNAKGTVKRLPQTQAQIDQGKLGDIIYQYRVGDPVLVNGNPVIDELQGIEIRSHLLMIELEFLLVNSRLYDDGLRVADRYVKEFLNYSSGLAESALENTTYEYKPKKSSTNVLVVIDGVKQRLKQNMSPSVELFVDTNSNFTLDVPEIGRVIQVEIEKDIISLDSIRKAITKRLGITAVAIKDLGIGIDSEFITILENQFSIGKKLTLGGNVEYDITVKTTLI